MEELRIILATEFKGKPAKPEDSFDASFVRELDQSGFTDALYKKRQETKTTASVTSLFLA